ncbi:MAG: ligase-associated DNA damage response endonuclease PdeM [Phycisphaerales bacterium JB065]
MMQPTAPNTADIPTRSISLEVAGESLQLFPQRAICWEAQHTLFIADPHFGKAQTFRSAGIAAPERSHDADLTILTELINQTRSKRLIVLGDLLHARSGVRKPVLDALASWREQHPSLEILLVRGNHDRSSGDPPDALRITCVDPGHRLGPFTLLHEPDEIASDGYALCGHIHPGLQLGGSGGLGRKTGAKFPAFVFGERQAILPAFGRFTGLASIRPCPGDRIAVIADSEVIAITPR